MSFWDRLRQALVVSLVALLSAGIFASGTAGQASVRPTAPTLPRAYLQTPYPSQAGRTIMVHAGGDLQAALNSAQPGDTVSLEAGAVFRGNFTLPRKTGTSWIVVRSAAPDSSLPPAGTRISASSAGTMPKLVSPNGLPALQTAAGAHHYRLVAVELTIAEGVKTTYSILAFGGDQRSEEDTSQQLVVDRCYIHGLPTANAFRGVLLNSASSAIVDSYIADIHVSGFDSQAIGGYNGPGPFKIVNNYLEAAGENIMFGGADPKIPNLIPADIEIRRNHLFKPLAWRQGDPKFAGIPWTVKNLLELKNAERVHIEGNLLENVWAHAQTGGAVLLTPRNQEGGASWSAVRDVTFRNNIVRNAALGLSGQISDDGHPSAPMARIAIVNNLWLQIDRSFFTITQGPGPAMLEDIVIDHNTAIPTQYLAWHTEGPTPPMFRRFQLTNNIIGFGAFGTRFDGRDRNSIQQWFLDWWMAKNVLVSLGDVGDGQGSGRNQPQNMDATLYRSFPSAGAAGLTQEGLLTANSPLRRAATDGKDLGADFTAISAAMKQP